MSSRESFPAPSDEVLVQLIDAALGRPVKSWRFLDRTTITIGRSPDCDVEIYDPYVSRIHAELRCQSGRWTLLARGQHGVVVHHEKITELPIDSEVSFNLGATGPMLRFALQSDEVISTPTVCFEDVEQPDFVLDQSKVGAEVNQITQDDYFQKLQSQAKALRAGRRK
jgi:pSer/pThr/pTyr-binding forkhead associated (FHA) protein